MNLMEEIEEEIKRGGSPKWAILKEKAEKEILKMIESGISLEKQIDLLLKHGIVKKLERKEYTNILKKHFGYQGARRKKKNTKVANRHQETETTIRPNIERKNTEESIEEKLSKETTFLRDSLLEKKAAGIS